MHIVFTFSDLAEIACGVVLLLFFTVATILNKYEGNLWNKKIQYLTLVGFERYLSNACLASIDSSAAVYEYRRYNNETIEVLTEREIENMSLKELKENYR